MFGPYAFRRPVKRRKVVVAVIVYIQLFVAQTSVRFGVGVPYVFGYIHSAQRAGAVFHHTEVESCGIFARGSQRFNGEIVLRKFLFCILGSVAIVSQFLKEKVILLFGDDCLVHFRTNLVVHFEEGYALFAAQQAGHGMYFQSFAALRGKLFGFGDVCVVGATRRVAVSAVYAGGDNRHCAARAALRAAVGVVRRVAVYVGRIVARFARHGVVVERCGQHPGGIAVHLSGFVSLRLSVFNYVTLGSVFNYAVCIRSDDLRVAEPAERYVQPVAAIFVYGNNHVGQTVYGIQL